MNRQSLYKVLPVFLLFLAGGCLLGCESVNRLSPDQQRSAEQFFRTMKDLAAESGVVIIGEIEIQEPGFGTRTDFYLRGFHGRVIAIANPKASP